MTCEDLPNKTHVYSYNVKFSLEKEVDVKCVLLEIVAAWDRVAKFYRRPEIPVLEEKKLMREINNAVIPTIRVLFLLSNKIPESTDPIGTVVVACMKGDGHSIMKDTIALIFKASGYKVIYKLGGFPGETPDSLLHSIKTANADALLLSVLQPATFPMIKEAVEALKREGLRDKVLVVIGGGAVTEDISRKLGCDVYADHPLKALEVVERFIMHKRKNCQPNT